MIVLVTVKFESVPTDVKLLVTIVDFNTDPVNVSADAVTVILADPSNDVPLIFTAVASLVAVPALPSMLMPVKDCVALDLSKAIDVVPI